MGWAGVVGMSFAAVVGWGLGERRRWELCDDPDA